MNRPPTTRFARACRGLPVDRTPVWLMRQAGRYMPEYRAIRDGVDFLSFCFDPKLTVRATLDAVAFLQTDAAIIFSDITLPVVGMGRHLQFSPGPEVSPPIRSQSDVDQLRPLTPREDLGPVLEAIRRTREQLAPDISLIGFVGAPLTLAGYMVEGTPTPSWLELKRFLFSSPNTAHALLNKLAEDVAAHAVAQVEAGCDVIQLFDTTAGVLPEWELQNFAFAYAGRVIQMLKPTGVPVIYFARHIGAHLEMAAQLGADVLGLDWTVSVTEARRRLGDDRVLMGNLDPAVLLTNEAEIDRRVADILRQAEGLRGFVFNLGHGVVPPTPPHLARRVIQSVRRHGVRGDGS